MEDTHILSFRPLSQRDTETILFYTQDDLSCHKQSLISTNPDSETIVRRWIQQHETDTSKHYMVLSLDDMLAGVVGLTKICEHENAEIFYWIAMPYRGQGMTKYALEHLEQKATHRFSLSSLYAYVDQENKISSHILERNGYRMIMNAPETYFDQELYRKRIEGNENTGICDTYLVTGKPIKPETSHIRI